MLIVELLVAALVVVGLLVVAGRFLFRSKSGEIVLPAILDESVGMWALRRVTGLRLWERDAPADDEVAGSAADPPGSTAAPGWSGAPASTAVAWPDADPNARYQSARRSAAAAAAGGSVAGTPPGPAATVGSRWPIASRCCSRS